MTTAIHKENGTIVVVNGKPNEPIETEVINGLKVKDFGRHAKLTLSGLGESVMVDVNGWVATGDQLGLDGISVMAFKIRGENQQWPDGVRFYTDQRTFVQEFPGL